MNCACVRYVGDPSRFPQGSAYSKSRLQRSNISLPRLPRALSRDSETGASREGGDRQPSVGGSKLVFLSFTFEPVCGLKQCQNQKQNRSWSLEAAPRRSKPILLHLGHLRPAPVLPLLVLGVRVSVSQAGGVLHHRPKELHRGPLPPERAVHGCRFAAGQSAV